MTAHSHASSHTPKSFETRTPRLLLAAAALAILSGCASGASVSGMTADVSEATLIEDDSPLFGGVVLSGVSGGEDTNPLWTSEVGDAEYAEALRLSLANHAMLTESGGRYALTAELLEVDQPFGGFNLEVVATARYVMTEIASGAIAFDQRYTTPFTANFSSSFLAVERLRLANEGAMRENIRAFLVDVVKEFGAAGGPLISMDRVEILLLADARERR